MTDFELIATYTDVSANLFMLFTIYYSVIFAFILAAYFVAQQLKPIVAGLLAGLFIVTMALAMYQQSLLVFSMIALGMKIKYAVLNGNTDLAWHAYRAVPDFLSQIIPWTFTAANLVAYVGALYVFNLCRRGDLGVK